MALTVLPAGVAAQLAGARTYPGAGGTRGPLPAGYQHLARTAVIGTGRAVFATAAEAVLCWQVQLRAGLHVQASSPTAADGAVLILRMGLGPFRLSAPCRVVYTVDEHARRGFAYGTLPGHPESGEEAFIVERHGDGTVTFTVTAFSRPGSLAARLAGPAGGVIQRRIIGRYLRAL